MTRHTRRRSRSQTGWPPTSSATEIVSSFNRESLAVVKDLAPEVPTGQLAGFALDPWVVIEEARSDGHVSVNLSLARTLSDAERIVEAAGDLAVLVWTVNDPNHAIALAEAGVSGISPTTPD